MQYTEILLVLVICTSVFGYGCCRGGVLEGSGSLGTVVALYGVPSDSISTEREIALQSEIADECLIAGRWWWEHKSNKSYGLYIAGRLRYFGLVCALYS